MTNEFHKATSSPWPLVWILAKTDFTLRYQGSVLGFLWALLKPMMLFLVLYFVFSHLFAPDVPYYAIHLLTGILLWNFFAEGTMAGLTSMTNKAHLLTKIAFPRWIIVVASVLQVLMTFLITLIILCVTLLLSGMEFQLWQFAAFLGYLFLLMTLVMGFSFLTAPLFIRFRDLNQIWEVLLMVGFYAAPIIYPLSVLPSWIQPWLYLNPMTFLIEHAKGVLFMGSVSRWDHHLVYIGIVFFLFLFGVWFFRRYEGRVVELL